MFSQSRASQLFPTTKDLWALYPMFCELWSLVFTSRKDTIVGPKSVRVLFLLILSGGSFPGLGSFLRSGTYTWGWPLSHPQGSFLVLAQQTLATLVSRDSQLHILNQWVFQKLLGIPLPTLFPGHSIKTLSWGRQGSPCLLLLSQESPSFMAWYPVFRKLLFHIFCPFFGCPKQEGKSSFCYSILVTV